MKFCVIFLFADIKIIFLKNKKYILNPKITLKYNIARGNKFQSLSCKNHQNNGVLFMINMK